MITKLDNKTEPAPMPRKPYEMYKSTKLFANDATVRLIAQVRHPIMEITRQPNRLTREPANGPTPKAVAMDIEPTQAER